MAKHLQICELMYNDIIILYICNLLMPHVTKMYVAYELPQSKY